MLNADELKHGPGPRLAFLASPDAQSLAEIMVAFANTEGGIIVVGLEANGQPAKGASISEDEMQKLLEAAENLFNPGIVIEDWEELDIEDEDFFETNAVLVQGRIVIPANVSIKPTESINETPAIIPSVPTPAIDTPASPTAETNPTSVPAAAEEGEKTVSIALDVPASAALAVPVETPAAVLEVSKDTPADTVVPAVQTPETPASASPSTAGSVLQAAPATTETPAANSVEAAIKPETEAAPSEAEAKPAETTPPDAAAEKIAETPVDTPVQAVDAVSAAPTESASAVETPKPETSEAAAPSVAASPVEITTIPESAPVQASDAVETSAVSTVSDTVEPSSEPTPTPAAVPPTVPVSETPTLPPLYGVKIPRSIELHALNDGRVLIRSGARNRPLGGQEILRLASAKGTGEFEAEIVPGASQADFSRRLIDEYLIKRAERTKRPFSGSIDEMLLEIGALTPDRHPTTAGILLFSEYPQKWLPQSSLIFARFVGTQPRGESGMAGYIRREEITGPLPRLIEAAWNLVWSEMAVSAVVSGLEREDRAEYPQFAVREAIVNSICHRDYRLRGRRIELRMYSDRLEVISPGGLPGFITVENIKDEHFSRNPRIVNGLFQWGYIEELGLGIDRMIEVMEQAGREPPQFDARPYSFAVTLNNEREKQRPLDWIRSANHRQARAMQYIREHGSITNREYRILCAGVSAETLRLDLAGMVDRGQLIKVGSKKGTHYILRDKDVPDLEHS